MKKPLIFFSRYVCQAVSSEIASGLSEDHRCHTESAARGERPLGESAVSCLADLTALEAGGLGGLDFEEEAGPAVRRSSDVQAVDLDYQVPVPS